jgi:4-hydroxy-2-oxoheptanedioate aldolase
MKLTPNPFTHAIRRGEKQIGLWLTSASTSSAEVIASAGYDWVVVDMEHAPNHMLSVRSQLQVLAASPTTALARPDWNDAVEVKRLLDLGADGLVFPMIQTVEEAEKAVASTRYPPRGIRGVSGVTRANKYGRVRDYFDRIEDETTVILQLETVSAIERAEEIAAVDGVDGIFFGPADISADMGLLGQTMAPAVWELIWAAAEKLIAKDVPVGTLVLDPAFAAKLLNDGFTFVACGVDTALLAQSSDQLLAHVKGDMS